ncbi:pyridoxamine 5'-phosphate oxidase family protein [Phytoactinopolyspora endophytica]|uniref:pyridoxamine 5'-phosphate oxidase family protein n=1 Tax=Phytoactinopolyspora endophytica TaxID=1642495 RepID=UPI00101E1366|nr:pyridoxamine 5'-phosphate oxidase family protein [Phytoactinopolyspora endophytica]
MGAEPRVDVDSAGLEVLSREQCFELLESVPIGRIVFTEGALPAIQPVNFLLDSGNVVIRIGPGSKLAAAARSAVVAFEADSYDAEALTGWSVVLIGRAEAVGREEHERIAGLRLTPWALGAKPHYIRITPEIVRGRRINGQVPAV